MCASICVFKGLSEFQGSKCTLLSIFMFDNTNLGQFDMTIFPFEQDFLGTLKVCMMSFSLCNSTGNSQGGNNWYT